jgi:NAD(P)-dependent dehydrogenase (short-subunit alcohol dehydrogenase family)
VSTGLGQALACAYLDRGDRVYGVSRRQPSDLVRRQRFAFASVDLSELDAVVPRLESLLRGVDALDLVVLNAAVLPPVGDMRETPLATLKHAMDVNTWANKILLDFVFDRVARVDQVIAISSGAAVSSTRGWNGYSISKAALNALVRLYAAERPQTHFSAFAPGLVDTGMQAYLRSMPADARYPGLEGLKRARGTPDMPAPDAAALRLVVEFERLRAEASGGFHKTRAR